MRAELHLLGRALRSHRRRLDHPFKLTFATTWACQSSCELCMIWRRKPRNELSAAEIRTLFRKAPRFSWIDLSGGEPFLRPDIVDVAAAAVEECPSLLLLHLPTNGLAPARVDQDVRAIAALKPRKLLITVSVDGPPGLNERLRGHPEAWGRAMETLRRLRGLRGELGARRFDVFLGVTLSEHNREQAAEILPAVQRDLPGFGRSELHWNLAQRSEHYYGNEGVLDRAPTVRLAEQLSELAGDGGLHPARWLSPVRRLDHAYRRQGLRFARTGRSPVRCRALWSTAFLDPEGTLYPCITWDAPLGTLREHDLDLLALWNTEPVRETSAQVAQGRCPQCWTPCEAVPALLGSLHKAL